CFALFGWLLILTDSVVMTRILNANPNKVTKPLACAGGFVLYSHSRGVVTSSTTAITPSM
ncbi:TPA: hypothetical protein ACMW3P_002169, partial [Neisseria gonorrhoeae]